MMDIVSGKTRRLALGAAFAAAVGLIPHIGFAQGVDCAQLRGQLASLRGNPALAQRYLQEAANAQRQLDQLQNYAQSIGCQNHRFLFFGSDPPAECRQINPKIERLQANLRNLQQRASEASGESRRRQLENEYNSYCGDRRQAGLGGPQGFFEQLFGGGGQSQTPETNVPISPNPDQGLQAGQAQGGSKAVCVRLCDGSFFPISYVASASDYPELQRKCDLQSPGAKTELFLMPEKGVIDQAVSVDGQPYSSLPNADLFQTKYVASCSSRPPNESWAQALSKAEEMSSGGSGSDIIVTRAKSAQMSELASPESGRPGKASGRKATVDDEQTAGDLANSNQAPTGGDESADISGTMVKGKFYGEHAGHVEEETGPNGVKRRVRIIGPQP